MTNEEIYKYAWKSGSYGDKLQKRQLKSILPSASLALLGIFMIGMPLTHLNLCAESIGCAFMIILAMIYFGVFMKTMIRFKKELTEYEYNLVRADERKRCMTKMERYEHEGSKREDVRG
jgi:hypothetical protein